MSTRQLQIYVLPMGKEGYNLNDICKRIKDSELWPDEKTGDYCLAVKNNTSPNDQWQAEYLLITDPQAEIKAGDKLLYFDLEGKTTREVHTVISVLLATGYIETDKSLKWKELYVPPKRFKKIISAYPQLHDIPLTPLSIVQQLVDSNMSAMAEVEMVAKNCDCHLKFGYLQPMCAKEYNCVEDYARHPSGEIKMRVVEKVTIQDLASGKTSEWMDNAKERKERKDERDRDTHLFASLWTRPEFAMMGIGKTDFINLCREIKKSI